MKTRKELIETGMELAASIRELADRQNEWSAEDREKWDEVNGLYNANATELEQLDNEERAAEVEKQAEELAASRRPSARSYAPPSSPSSIPSTPEQRERDLATTLQAFGMRNRDNLTPEHFEAGRRMGINVNAPEIAIDIAPTASLRTFCRAYSSVHPTMAEERALSAITGPAGGYTVPEGFVPRLEKALAVFAGIRTVSEILRTASGNDLPWPTVDDRDPNNPNPPGEPLNENEQVSELDVTFDQVVLKAWKYGSHLVRVPTELLEDSAFDMAMVLADLLGERLGRTLNQKYTIGAGTTEPQGVVGAVTVGHTAGAGTLDADDVIDLAHSVDPAYRSGPNVRYMLNDTTFAFVRKLKGTDGQYIWQTGLQAGIPDLLYGFRTVLNPWVPDVGADGSMLFGDFSKFKIREVRTLRLLRLVERYADFDQTGFVAFMRADSNLVDAGGGAIKKMTHV